MEPTATPKITEDEIYHLARIAWSQNLTPLQKSGRPDGGGQLSRSQLYKFGFQDGFRQALSLRRPTEEPAE